MEVRRQPWRCLLLTVPAANADELLMCMQVSMYMMRNVFCDEKGRRVRPATAYRDPRRFHTVAC